MENKSRHYEFEGAVFDIPMYYDALADMYIEEYRNFYENPVWTKDGHPIMGSVEEACPCGEWDEPERCNTCGSCRYFRFLAPHTLIGVCRQDKRLWANKTEQKN
ncbi:MAG: hypothetical protein LUF27_01790 [Lachnospiraceae bacterium]|nr:hypothetical protein [Lachnospiraceae bacterium]